MIRVTRVAEDGTESAVVEIDDFTVEVLYSGIADLLREAGAVPPAAAAGARELPRQNASAGRGSWPASAFDICSAVRACAAPTSVAPCSGWALGPGNDSPPDDRGHWGGGRTANLSRHAHLPGGHPRHASGPGCRRYAVPLLTWSNGRHRHRPHATSPAPSARRACPCIAEIKRRSPSKGDLDPALQPDLVAKEYAAGGAACISVLTDAEYFGGSPPTWRPHAASGLPVLRKDFTVQEADVVDARSWAPTPSC